MPLMMALKTSVREGRPAVRRMYLQDAKHSRGWRSRTILWTGLNIALFGSGEGAGGEASFNVRRRLRCAGLESGLSPFSVCLLYRRRDILP